MEPQQANAVELRSKYVLKKKTSGGNIPWHWTVSYFTEVSDAKKSSSNQIAAFENLTIWMKATFNFVI